MSGSTQKGSSGTLRWLSLVSLCTLIIAAAVTIATHHGIPTLSSFSIPVVAAAIYGTLWYLSYRMAVNRQWQIKPGRMAAAFLAGLTPLALNLPYLWYRSGNKSSSEIDFIPNRFTISAEILLGAVLVLVIVIILTDRWPAADRKNEAEHPWKILVPTLILWTLAGSVLSILMHHFMHESGPNTTMIVQGLKNIFDEQGPLYAKVLQADGSSILGVHANFVFFLLYPFYRAAPRYETVLILGQIGMALAAIPLYKLARLVLSYRISLLVTFIFLTNPVIAGSGPTQDMSELRFLAFPFFMSLIFFQKKRLAPFLLFAAASILIREDVGLLYVLLGIYAFLIHRSWQWNLIPIVSGTAWFVIMTTVVIPHFNPAGEFTRLAVVYEEYGGTQTGLIMHLATHPWQIFSRIFANASNIGLTYGLWQTIGLGVPLLSGIMILVFPGMAELLLLESGSRASINSHHAIIIAVPMFAALIFGISRLDRWTERFISFSRGRLTLIVVVLMLFSSIGAFHVWFNPDRYQPRYNYNEALDLIDMVPDNTSVVLPMYLLIHSQDSQEAVGYYQIAYRVDQSLPILQEDYIIIDNYIPPELKNLRVYSGLASLRAALAESGDYEQGAVRGDLTLYVKKDTETSGPDS